MASARSYFLIEPGCRIRGQVGGRRGGVAVVSRRATEGLELQPPLPQCEKIALPVGGVCARHLPQTSKIFQKVWEIGIDYRIRAKSWNDSSLEARCADGFMMSKRIERRIRGRQYFNSKSFEQSSRTKFRGLQFFHDGVVIFVRVFRIEPGLQFKELLESQIQPESRRRPAEEMVILREYTPDTSGILK